MRILHLIRWFWKLYNAIIKDVIQDVEAAKADGVITAEEARNIAVRETYDAIALVAELGWVVVPGHVMPHIPTFIDLGVLLLNILGVFRNSKGEMKDVALDTAVKTTEGRAILTELAGEGEEGWQKFTQMLDEMKLEVSPD